MKILFTSVIFLLFTFVTRAKTLDFTEVNLSDSAKVSIITCGPGNELYSLFGHTAIRVLDPNNNIDLVFNYGTFEFSTPNFMSKFIKGELDYYLSYYPYFYFEPSYIEENRWVSEQLLILSNKQVNDVFKALIINGRRENRYYRYDFFFDNCATRVRDILCKAVPGITFSNINTFTNVTFRDEMNKYLVKSDWTKFGLNLILGRFCDDQVTSWSSMYLPNNLMKQFSKASIKHNETNNISALLAPFNIQLVSSTSNSFAATFFKPIYLIILLLAIAISLHFFQGNSRFGLVFDSSLWISFFLMSLILVFLSFFSSHTICRQNLNLLWLSPTYIFLLYPIGGRYGFYIHKGITYLILLQLFLFTVLAIIGVQKFALETYLLICIIVSRLFPKLNYKAIL